MNWMRWKPGYGLLNEGRYVGKTSEDMRDGRYKFIVEESERKFIVEEC